MRSLRLAELLPVAAGQVPHVPGAEQRRAAIHAPHSEHQFRREGRVGLAHVRRRQAAAGAPPAQRAHVTDGVQRDRLGPREEQQPRRGAARPPQEPVGPRRVERPVVGAILGVGLAVRARQGGLVGPRQERRRILVIKLLRLIKDLGILRETCLFKLESREAFKET